MYTVGSTWLFNYETCATRCPCMLLRGNMMCLGVRFRLSRRLATGLRLE